jgi:hypothetical protein
VALTQTQTRQLWAGDNKNRILSNLIDGYGGAVVLLTITAPGADVLPWDGERVEREAARAWNVSAPKQWSAMHRRLAVVVGRLGLKPNLLAYVWAFQKRGVLHLHLALGAETVAESYAAKVYGQLLKGDRATSDPLRVAGVKGPADLGRGWAKESGFGFVDVQPMRGGAKGLASYLAKYVCKDGVNGRPELAETVDHPDVPARPIYVSRQLTATTRCTMRNLRLRRYFWRAATCRQAGLVTCDYAEDMAARGLKVRAGRLFKPLSQRRRGP